jgi:apolipoprotein N-acyltransferase
MVTAKLIAKTIGISIAAFVVLVAALATLVAVGVPPAILAPAAWLSFAAFGYFQSKTIWNSRKPWAWALAGFFLGIFAFPFFWFCYEHYRATGEKVEATPEVSLTAVAEGMPVLVPSPVEEATPQSRFVAH